MKNPKMNRIVRALSPPGQVARFAVAVAFVGLLAGACDVHTPTAPGSVYTITVTPNVTLDISATQQFIAVGKDAEGRAVAITPTWSVVASGGSIDNAGMFTAGPVAGTFPGTVKATSGAASGTASVVVLARLPPIVPLGQGGVNGILAGTTFTCITGGVITGDVGVWPGTANTGFPPCTVSGTQQMGNAVSQTAQGELTAAYNQLAGMACSPANALTGQDLGGMTLAPGVYCFSSSAFLTGTLNLAGPANGTWVFQIASTLITATNSAVVLSGGAAAQNVYWQVGSSATIAIGTAMQGNIVALTSISLKDNATLVGRALARNGGVTLDNNNVITVP